ncbi:androgen-induced gene 1 protein isoform X2 [Apteryx rowi]|uniref:androgen-induced gene 1 protein isoform X2 n=1 Tax=Apteryx rowi TaxID=308060 RepID=UPI000E1DA371|nr:androgen-induced gene 1 protein isoform X2 [Apteryx rowi]
MALVPCQVLRAAILLSYCSILCNYKAIDMPAHQTYGGSWKFLTFIDLVIQAVFFGICVLTDLSSLLTKGNDSQEQERQLKKLISLRDWMMAVLAFPIGVFVVTMFWSIYIYDRELVYPKLLDNFIPAWLNHGMVETMWGFDLVPPTSQANLEKGLFSVIGYLSYNVIVVMRKFNQNRLYPTKQKF